MKQERYNELLMESIKAFEILGLTPDVARQLAEKELADHYQPVDKAPAPTPECNPTDLSSAGRKKSTSKRPQGYRSLLNVQNAKTQKGEKLGYLTGILYLSPAHESGVMNTCSMASPECIAACLKSSGRMAFDSCRNSRIDKTLLLHNDRALFLECLRYDIEALVRRAAKIQWTDENGVVRVGMIPAVRINGTSDLAWIALQMSAEYPTVQFYDYTKLPKAEQRVRANYSIMFSYSGWNLTEALRVLPLGVNVSVVFNTRNGQALPASWNGYRVVDGDTHDLRFLDDKGVVVGLRAKGVARKQTSPFIVLT